MSTTAKKTTAKAATEEVAEVVKETTEAPEVKAEKTEEKEAVISVKAPKAKAAEEVRVYIGPTLQNIARSNTIYRGELPEKLKKAIEGDPILRSLIVTLEKYPSAAANANTPGTALNLIYEKVKKL